jgi:hypothetical protein
MSTFRVLALVCLEATGCVILTKLKNKGKVSVLN